jgi:hypothetical protein
MHGLRPLYEFENGWEGVENLTDLVIPRSFVNMTLLGFPHLEADSCQSMSS